MKLSESPALVATHKWLFHARTFLINWLPGPSAGQGALPVLREFYNPLKRNGHWTIIVWECRKSLRPEMGPRARLDRFFQNRGIIRLPGACRGMGYCVPHPASAVAAFRLKATTVATSAPELVPCVELDRRDRRSFAGDSTFTHEVGAGGKQFC